MDRITEEREINKNWGVKPLKEVGKSDGRPWKGGEESPGRTLPLNPIYWGPNSRFFSVLC